LTNQAQKSESGITSSFERHSSFLQVSRKIALSSDAGKQPGYKRSWASWNREFLLDVHNLAMPSIH